MTRDEVDLRNLANRLRELFAASKFAKDGVPYRPHKRYDGAKCWLETAKVVQRLKATPEDYIEAQFRYSASTLFANTLHGPKAQQRYAQFKAMHSAKPENITPCDDIGVNTPGKAEVLSRRASTLALVVSVCGDESIENPKVKNFLLDSFSNVDELGALLLYGTDPDIRRKFSLPVSEMMVQSPYLRRAVQELGFDIEALTSEQ